MLTTELEIRDAAEAKALERSEAAPARAAVVGVCVGLGVGRALGDAPAESGRASARVVATSREVRATRSLIECGMVVLRNLPGVVLIP
jgi:hypothetical protein